VAAGILTAAVNAAKAAGQIHSPSRLTAQIIDIPLGRGVAVGIASTTGLVNASMANLIGSIPAQSVSTSQMLGRQSTGPAPIGNGGGTVVQVFALKSDELTQLIRQAESGHGAALYVDGLERAFAGVMGG